MDTKNTFFHSSPSASSPDPLLQATNQNKESEDLKTPTELLPPKAFQRKQSSYNHVIWPVSFREMGNDLSQACDQLEVKQNMVLKYLKDGGLTDEEITIAAPKLGTIWLTTTALSVHRSVT